MPSWTDGQRAVVWAFLKASLPFALKTTTFADKLPQDEHFQAVRDHRPCKIGETGTTHQIDHRRLVADIQIDGLPEGILCRLFRWQSVRCCASCNTTTSVPIQHRDHNASSRVKENSQGVRPLQKIHINRKTTPSGPGILTIRPNPTETLRS